MSTEFTETKVNEQPLGEMVLKLATLAVNTNRTSHEHTTLKLMVERLNRIPEPDNYWKNNAEEAQRHIDEWLGNFA